MISGLFSQDPKDNPEIEIIAYMESLYKLDKEKMETFASTLCPAIQPFLGVQKFLTFYFQISECLTA